MLNDEVIHDSVGGFTVVSPCSFLKSYQSDEWEGVVGCICISKVNNYPVVLDSVILSDYDVCPTGSFRKDVLTVIQNYETTSSSYV